MKFYSLSDLLLSFPDENACIKHLEKMRWNDVVVSPFDASSRVYKCKNHRYRCRNTKKYFNVKTGTMFDNTKVDLRKWYIAIWLVTCHKKGISSMQLSRDLGVTQKTAWFMLCRIRNCFSDSNGGVLFGDVEVDETYVGGKNKNRHKNKKVKNSQGRSYKDKTPVFGLVQRNGYLITRKVPDVKGNTIKGEIFKHADKTATIYSDEWWAYHGLSRYYAHYIVEHGKGEYVKGPSHCNSMEGAWSHLKRMLTGVYHQVSKKHLQRYLDEFTFRYNRRDYSDSDKMSIILSHCHYRLKYKELIFP